MKRLPPLNALRAFTRAAQTGSFTKAGESMHVTQGAISRQVKLLEASLKIQLFDRVHQSINLTPAGQALATSLIHAFELIEVAVANAEQRQNRQMLAINVPPTFATRWLAPRLSDFRVKHPLIDLSITTDRIQNKRAIRQYDCLVFFDREPWPDMQCEPLMKEQHIMACSPSLWVNKQPPDLSQATLLHILDGDRRLPVWEQWVAAHGMTHLDTKAGLNFSTLDQAINASVSGAGIVVVDTAMIINELKSGLLKRVAAGKMDGPQGYWFVDVTQNTNQKSLVSSFEQWLIGQTRQAKHEKF